MECIAEYLCHARHAPEHARPVATRAQNAQSRARGKQTPPAGHPGSTGKSSAKRTVQPGMLDSCASRTNCLDVDALRVALASFIEQAESGGVLHSEQIDSTQNELLQHACNSQDHQDQAVQKATAMSSCQTQLQEQGQTCLFSSTGCTLISWASSTPHTSRWVPLGVVAWVRSDPAAGPSFSTTRL